MNPSPPCQCSEPSAGSMTTYGCRYTHPLGRGGFATVEHGQQFREAAYQEAHLKQPAPWQLGGAPRTITLLSAVTGEMVCMPLRLAPASDCHQLACQSLSAPAPFIAFSCSVVSISYLTWPDCRYRHMLQAAGLRQCVEGL